MTSKVPRPGPAKLGPNAGIEEWLAEAKLCRYLPESAMKQLCEIVKACLMEGVLIYPSEQISVLISPYRIKHPAGSNSGHNLR